MIDVQAADAPGSSRSRPASRSVCCAPGTRRDALDRADATPAAGAGTWSVSAPGLDAPARSTCPPAARRSSSSRSRPPGAQLERQPLRQRRADARGRTPCTSAGGATSSARGSPSVHSRTPRGRALGQGRHARGHEARRSLPLAGQSRRQRPAAHLPGPRAAVVVHGAAPARATPASWPRALSCRRSCSRATRTGSRASPPCPRTAIRTSRPTAASRRSAGCSCPRRAATSSSSRRARVTSRAPIGCGSGSTIARRP